MSDNKVKLALTVVSTLIYEVDKSYYPELGDNPTPEEIIAYEQKNYNEGNNGILELIDGNKTHTTILLQSV